MNIYAIMLVKNEADIVGKVLAEAQKWADKIFILDNGSTDGSWEIIQSMKNDIVVPWKQYFGEYHDGLRADVYNEFKSISKPGDWWCFKLDADEIYAEDPREFLKTIPSNCHMVAKQSLDYVITNEDLQEYTYTGNFEEDIKHLQYFKVPCWSEPRFFRYRKGLKWINNQYAHWPQKIGVLADKNILCRHYQCRSPEQLQARLDLRNNTRVKKEGVVWRGDKETKWQELVKPRCETYFDDGNFEEIRKLPINRGEFRQGKLKCFVKRFLIALHLYQ